MNFSHYSINFRGLGDVWSSFHNLLTRFRDFLSWFINFLGISHMIPSISLGLFIIPWFSLEHRRCSIISSSSSELLEFLVIFHQSPATSGFYSTQTAWPETHTKAGQRNKRNSTSLNFTIITCLLPSDFFSVVSVCVCANSKPILQWYFCLIVGSTTSARTHCPAWESWGPWECCCWTISHFADRCPAWNNKTAGLYGLMIHLLARQKTCLTCPLIQHSQTVSFPRQLHPQVPTDEHKLFLHKLLNVSKGPEHPSKLPGTSQGQIL